MSPLPVETVQRLRRGTVHVFFLAAGLPERGARLVELAIKRTRSLSGSTNENDREKPLNV